MIDWVSTQQRLRDGESDANRALTSEPERLAAVYRQRAARLAARKPATAAAATIPILVFELNPEQYGIELRGVVQVMPFANCTPVPGAPPSLLGVINLRGEIRSVIDLRQLLQLPPAVDESPGYLIILRHGDSSIGARVDQVERVRQVAPEELLVPNEELTQLNGRFARGVTSDKLIVLSAEALFSHSIFTTSRTKDADSRAAEGSTSRSARTIDKLPMLQESRQRTLNI